LDSRKEQPGAAATEFNVTRKIKIESPLQYNYTVIMNSIVFEWDDKKAKSNLKKHGVSFEEAQTVFFDDMAIQFWDSTHFDEEQRFLMLGLSNKLRILLVVHCFRESDSTIRIISTIKATKREMNEYPGG
jgi:uncharacterized DUF497 family protein